VITDQILDFGFLIEGTGLLYSGNQKLKIENTLVIG
jgi:hypothetical protein